MEDSAGVISWLFPRLAVSDDASWLVVLAVVLTDFIDFFAR